MHFGAEDLLDAWQLFDAQECSVSVALDALKDLAPDPRLLHLLVLLTSELKTKDIVRVPYIAHALCIALPLQCLCSIRNTNCLLGYLKNSLLCMQSSI